ncbi:hypothetical protein [Schaedlerella arabinosiphila]|uniref:hypothetical protein n=1 Tax=Schaedlerella arabinosiphila TaxID=2044587 RepID=UPI0013903AB7|nr:hypothetical protein [Schaedlerella arabinosiphila]
MNEVGWMSKEHPTVQVEHLPLTAPVYHGIKTDADFRPCPLLEHPGNQRPSSG